MSKTQFYGTQNHQKSLEVNKVCTLICCTDCVLILFPVLWQLAKRIEHYVNWKMLSRPILIRMILLSPFPSLFLWKNGKNNFPSRTIFFQPGKIFLPIFPIATLQKNNEISNKNNLLGLRKDRKKLEKERTIINERS